MKTIMKFSAIIASVAMLATSCIKEIDPQTSYATVDQVSKAPNAYKNYVDAITSSLVGSFVFGSSNCYPYDYGYPSFFLQRDVMGQDIVLEDTGSEWYGTWYQVGTGLGPRYLVCQLPWTYYYSWIASCNTVISLSGEEPSTDETREGAGIAYAMRAMFYMDLARMFQYTYKGHEQEGTVPIVTEKTTSAELANNPRATNEAMWAFILEDLNKAEQYLADYTRGDVYTPDISVVYGLKARAYLTMENWAEAEKYAKLAQAGYTMLNELTYTDRMTAFNTPNSAWMFGVQWLASDDNILLNDADSNWGSQMYLEVKGGLYGSCYGTPKRIDKHLYETIPATDFRKKCYIDFALDEMDDDARNAALAAYTDYPEYIDQCVDGSTTQVYGGLSLKFRAAGGAAGRTNPYAATCSSVPLMRVEEMILIEAEAAGMQSEGRGIELLTAFAKTRDLEYKYDNSLSFQDNVWWQRRVELWGEGFATYDIKRLNKGITRSYAGTNHAEGYRYNTETVPYWMNLCIVQTETNYNMAIGDYVDGGDTTGMNNPTPQQPNGDSPEHVW